MVENIERGVRKVTLGEGTTSDVTCKRCMKYAKEAEENDGVVHIRKGKR